MGTSSRRLVFILVGIAAVSVGSYFLPAVPGVAHVSAHHVRVALTVLMTAAFCGSAVLFLAGVQSFRAELQRAYRWFAGGMILFGIALLQWPVIVLRGLTGSFWATSGIVVVPFIFATAFMYSGMVRFAGLLGVRGWITSWPVGVAAVAVFTGLSGPAAHLLATNNTPGPSTETYTATVAWSTGYGLLAWLLVLKTRRATGEAYARPMGLLAIALGLLTFSGLHEYVTSYFLTEQDPYVYWGGTLWPFIVAGLVFLPAGHFFTPGHPAETAQTDNNTDESRAFTDSIVNVVGLASRPQELDGMLDELRHLTASLRPNAPLTLEQREGFVSLYLKIEKQLIASDPLKKFTVEELRSHIVPAFRLYLEQRRLPDPPRQPLKNPGD